MGSGVGGGEREVGGKTLLDQVVSLAVIKVVQFKYFLVEHDNLVLFVYAKSYFV